MNAEYSRQKFLGPNSVEVIKSQRVGIVGLCGGGSHVATQLAHIGFQDFIMRVRLDSST